MVEMKKPDRDDETRTKPSCKGLRTFALCNGNVETPRDYEGRDLIQGFG